MQINNKICLIKGVFDGIYSWGQGYRDIETAKDWEAYWESTDSPVWKYKKPEMPLESGDLVNVRGSIYMHPMGFTCVLHSCGVEPIKGDDDIRHYFGFTLDKLKELCEGAAKACGGTFQLYAEIMDADLELKAY